MSDTNVALEEIAIIGMAGRFPGAKNIEELWQNLHDGVESIVTFTDEELQAAGIDSELLSNPNYVKAGAPLDHPDLFDAAFFGFNPQEAAITDPQHRLFLECAHQALEVAGYDPQTYRGLIGVFAGAAASTYQTNNLQTSRSLLQRVSPFEIVVGNDKDFVPTRVSYKLNLRGPSINLQTACSTSLVAVHLACQSLLERACDIALAGGVSVRFPQRVGYLYEQEGILSPDGHCRAFDAEARGAVGGHGLGIVVLKRLSEAKEDGDNILAVIRGSAINNDGSRKVGYTAPGVAGQAEVIASAQAMAGVTPDTITCIEAHGTGTLLGDPIEVTALTQAFGRCSRGEGFCAIGSVKTNLGHLDAAAGVTGLIKMVLQLQQRQLVPSLNFHQPNPSLNLVSSPFYVNDRLREWPAGKTPRRGGVSSFGIGGTNAHMIVEEAPVREASSPSRAWQLLTVSAKTHSALETATGELVTHLKQQPEVNLADLTFTQHVGRTALADRRAAVCEDPADAIRVLTGNQPERLLTFYDAPKQRHVIFMFPGGGAQYVNMGRGLYETEPLYRKEIDRCAEMFRRHLEIDIREVMYPSSNRLGDAEGGIRKTRLGLPALFATEYAQAKLWRSWGIEPEALIGHSLGEYAAACIAEVFTLEEAVALVAARSSLMQKLPAGGMLAVLEPESDVRRWLPENLSIAAINGPSLCVVSGALGAIEQCELTLAERGCDCHRLHIDVASHCSLVDPIVGEFEEMVAELHPLPPRIPYISNVSGTWVNGIEVCDPHYWAKHLRQTVRFSDGLRELFKRPDRVFLEVGPGHGLSMLANGHPSKMPQHITVSSQRHPRDSQPDPLFLLTALAQLWVSGVQVNWSEVHRNEKRHRVVLPTYPFERQSYWVEPSNAEEQQYIGLKKKSDLADFFYVPVWKQLIRLRARKSSGGTRMTGRKWLLFMDQCGLGSRIAEQLERDGQRVVLVRAGQQFNAESDRVFTVDPFNPAHYDAILEELRETRMLPDTIVHLWGLTHLQDGTKEAVTEHELGFHSLIFLAQAIGNHAATESIRLEVVTSNLYRVGGEKICLPQKGIILGPCKVLPQEYANLRVQHIDVDLESLTGTDHLVEILQHEFCQESDQTSVVLRDGNRWIQEFEPMKLQAPIESCSRLRQGGVYLLTGGLGGMALEIATYLAKNVNAKLVLVSRSGISHRAESVAERIRRLEELGSQVLVFKADVADAPAMEAIIRETENRFGKIHGVVHAAGLPGGGLTQLKTVDASEQVLRPKLEGTLVLWDLCAGRGLDFLLLCSSLSALLGGVGHVDYCAANAFIDCFAQAHRNSTKVPLISVNWNAWQGVGMAASVRLPQDLADWERKIQDTGLTSDQGVEAFARVLANEVPQVAVCTQDLSRLMKDRSAFPAAGAPPRTVAPPKPAYARPNLPVAYVAPRNQLERELVSLWQEFLGIERIGVFDNFFSLGGHSLLGTRLMSRLRDSWAVNIPLRRLFESPTVAALAESIAIRQRELEEEEKLRLLARLEQLADDEIERELNKRATPGA